MTPKVTAEDIEHSESILRDALAASFRDFGTCHVIISRKATNPNAASGRSDCYSVAVLVVLDQGRPSLWHINYSLQVGAGMKAGRGDNKEYVRIEGHGFSKPDAIVDVLEQYAPDGARVTYDCL